MISLREGSRPLNLADDNVEVWAVSRNDGRRVRLQVVDAVQGVVRGPLEAGVWDFELVWPAHPDLEDDGNPNDRGAQDRQEGQS